MYNIVKVKSYLQINKKGCVYLWQNLQNLQVPVNQVNNVQYVLNAVNTATYNTNPAALQYNPIVAQTSNGTQYTFNYIQWQMYPQLLIDISNVLQIPYGGYLNTTFNNAPVQIVNYASEGFWQIGIGNN